MIKAKTNLYITKLLKGVTMYSIEVLFMYAREGANHGLNEHIEP